MNQDRLADQFHRLSNQFNCFRSVLAKAEERYGKIENLTEKCQKICMEFAKYYYDIMHK
jgi:hypothetical protein